MRKRVWQIQEEWIITVGLYESNSTFGVQPCQLRLVRFDFDGGHALYQR